MSVDALLRSLDDFARLVRVAEVRSGAMIALVPSPADAMRLAVPGGEPPDQLHLTLWYLGKAAEIPPSTQMALVNAVRSMVQRRALPVVEARAFGAALWNSDNADPARVLNVGDVPPDERPNGQETLAVVREMISEAWHDGMVPIDVPLQHSPWAPHVCLLYGDDPRVGEEAIAARTGPITFDRVRVAFGGEHVDIPLASLSGTRKFDPGQPRDPHSGEWIDGPGTAIRDVLKLADRIRLDPGETFAGSDRVSTDYGAVRLAATKVDGQPHLRIGVGGPGFGGRQDHQMWRGGGPDETADANVEPRRLRAEQAALKAEDDALNARRDPLVERYVAGLNGGPEISAADDAELDRLTERWAQIHDRLDELDNMDLNEVRPLGYSARLDQAGGERLRSVLADAMVRAKAANQARLDLPEDALLPPHETIAEGSIPGEWGTLHYLVEVDDPEVGPQTYLRVVPPALTLREVDGADQRAVLDTPDVDKLVVALGRLLDATARSATSTVRGFDPSQPRDPDGKWADGVPGAAVATAHKIGDWLGKRFDKVHFNGVDIKGAHFTVDYRGTEVPFDVSPLDVAALGLAFVPGGEGLAAAKFAALGVKVVKAKKTAKLVKVAKTAAAVASHSSGHGRNFNDLHPRNPHSGEFVSVGHTFGELDALFGPHVDEVDVADGFHVQAHDGGKVVLSIDSDVPDRRVVVLDLTPDKAHSLADAVESVVADAEDYEPDSPPPASSSAAVETHPLSFDDGSVGTVGFDHAGDIQLRLAGGDADLSPDEATDLVSALRDMADATETATADRAERDAEARAAAEAWWEDVDMDAGNNGLSMGSPTEIVLADTTWNGSADAYVPVADASTLADAVRDLYRKGSDLPPFEGDEPDAVDEVRISGSLTLSLLEDGDMLLNNRDGKVTWDTVIWRDDALVVADHLDDLVKKAAAAPPPTRGHRDADFDQLHPRSPEDGKFVNNGFTTLRQLFRDHGLLVTEVNPFGMTDTYVGLYTSGEVVVTTDAPHQIGEPSPGRTVAGYLEPDSARGLADLIDRMFADADGYVEEDDEGETVAEREMRLVDYDLGDAGVLVGYNPDGEILVGWKDGVDEPDPDRLEEDFDVWVMDPGDASNVADALREVADFEPEEVNTVSAGGRYDLTLFSDHDIAFTGDSWDLVLAYRQATGVRDALVDLRDGGAGVEGGPAVSRTLFATLDLEAKPDGTITLSAWNSNEPNVTIPAGDLPDVIEALDVLIDEAENDGRDRFLAGEARAGRAYNPSLHPHYPHGAPAGKGGQFMPGVGAALENLAGLHDRKAVTVRPAIAGLKSVADVNTRLRIDLRRTLKRPVEVDLGDKTNLLTAKEYAEGLLRGAERWPETRLDKVSVGTSPDGANVWGSTTAMLSSGRVEILLDEAASANRAPNLQKLRRGAARGRPGNDFAYVAASLFGSAVDGMTAGRGHDHVDTAIKAYLHDAGLDHGDPQQIQAGIKAQLGDHALRSREAMVAEALADDALHGDGASPLAKQVRAQVATAYNSRLNDTTMPPVPSLPSTPGPAAVVPSSGTPNVSAPATVSSAPPSNLDAIVRRLSELDSRGGAEAALKSMKVTELKALLKHLGLGAGSGKKKADLVVAIGAHLHTAPTGRAHTILVDDGSLDVEVDEPRGGDRGGRYLRVGDLPDLLRGLGLLPVAGEAPPALAVATVDSHAARSLLAALGGDQPPPEEHDDGIDLDEMSQALYDALVALDNGFGEDMARGFNPDQPRYPPGTPGGLGGKFMPMHLHLAGKLSKWQKGDRQGDPFEGFDREQLRRVAVKRGLKLRRNADREEIAKVLQDHLDNMTPAAGHAPAAPKKTASDHADAAIKQAYTSLIRGKAASIEPGELDGLLKALTGGGDEAKSANLANLDVGGYGTLFATDKPGSLSRDKMPQLGTTAEEMQKFFDVLKSNGVGVKIAEIDPTTLKPSQNEISGAKTGKLYGFMARDGWLKGGLLVTSNDGYVVDGHHRWSGAASARASGARPDMTVTGAIVDAPIDEVLKLASQVASYESLAFDREPAKT